MSDEKFDQAPSTGIDLGDDAEAAADAIEDIREEPPATVGDAVEIDGDT